MIFNEFDSEILYSWKGTQINLPKSELISNEEELVDQQIAKEIFIALLKRFSLEGVCLSTQQKAIALRSVWSAHNLILLASRALTRIEDCSKDGNADLPLIEAFIICSIALDIARIPPILRITFKPESALARKMAHLADCMWLQVLYNDDRLKTAGYSLPRLFGGASSGQARVLLALNEVHHFQAIPRKQKARWGLIRACNVTCKHAFERHLIELPRIYGIDVFGEFEKMQKRVIKHLQHRPLFRKVTQEKFDQLSVWQCAVVHYGRVSDAAKLYGFLTDQKVSRQAIANQLLRLERDLPEQMCIWRSS